MRRKDAIEIANVLGRAAYYATDKASERGLDEAMGEILSHLKYAYDHDGDDVDRLYQRIKSDGVCFTPATMFPSLIAHEQEDA